MLTPLMLLSFLNTSQAVPLQLTQQGRVLDNNGASVNGAHDLTFRIYDSSTGGSVYWSETLTVNFNNGYYAAILGTDEQNNPLDSSTLSLYPLYLEVQLDNNSPMTTRYSINSAPYAQMSGNAEVAESVDGGTVNATEVSINATQVIDGSGNWVGQPITVEWNNIDPNTIPSYIADGDDNTQLSEGQVEQYITNDPINLASGSELAGSSILTQPTNCLDSQLLVFNVSTSTWECGNDVDTTLTPTELQAMIEVMTLNLQNLPQVNGVDVVTTNSTLSVNQLDTTNSTNGDVLSIVGGNATWTQNSTTRSCPQDMALIDLVEGSEYCIDIYRAGANPLIGSFYSTTFSSALSSCIANGKRLCRAVELHIAQCFTQNLFNNVDSEWTSDPAYAHNWVVYSDQCTGTSQAYQFDSSFGYRCCQ